MTLPKKFIGWFFFIIGFLGAMLLGYINLAYQKKIFVNEIMALVYTIVYLGFLAAWYMLFDYNKKVEERLNEKHIKL